MTDHARVLTVLLERDFREDDLQALMRAIGLFKHVISVRHEPYTGFESLAVDAAKSELRRKIIGILMDTMP